jgi:hypothetical protein
MNTLMLSNEDHLKALAMAIARNKAGADEPVQTILLREGVSNTDYLNYQKDPVFQRYVLAYTKEMEENGVSFATKCRILAEDAIQSMYLMAKDVDTPAASRVKAVENLVEWSGLAAKAKIEQSAGASPGFHITFNIPSLGPERTVTLTAADTPPTFNMDFSTVENNTPAIIESSLGRFSYVPVNEIMTDIGYDAEE